jgi:hypothetical protein
MGLRKQLTEPWGIVTAGLLGGVGAAVAGALAPAGLAVGLPVGLGIAGVVYAVRVALGAVTDRDTGLSTRARPADTNLPTPPRGSPAHQWLRRAEAAVDTLHKQTESPPDPALRDQICDVDDEAAAALTDLRRFAGQVTLIDQTMANVPADRLRREHAAIERELSGLPAGTLRAERERARAAVGDQLAVAGRLAEAREMLLARLQSAVLGLEGLVARMAELLALHATTGSGSLTAARVSELTGDLEGMRAGLAEAERASRSALSGNDLAG